MSSALLVMTDGRRDCLTRTLAAAFEHLEADFVVRILHDDSGDLDQHEWLGSHYSSSFDAIVCGPKRLGQDHAIIRARAALAEAHKRHHFDTVFWLEDDMLMERDVVVAELAAVLARRPYLLQLALRRQPWFPAERRAGGIVERDPDEYVEVVDDDAVWLEHRLWFTHNPNLQRASLLTEEYPTGRRHEWRFSRQLAVDPAVRFGFWGARSDAPLVEHIGHERVGARY